MNNPANCPICGKYPMVWSAERHDFCVKIECCDHTIATPLGVIAKWNQYAAAMEFQARHNALRDAVAWERECGQLDFWDVAYVLCSHYPGTYIDTVRADFYAIRDSARAEVARLIGNESSADCQGEG